MKEEWKDHPRYEGLYQFSKMGRVKSFHRNKQGKIIKPTVTTHGRLVVNLRARGHCHMFFVHRLVLETFVGPCPPGLQCCHNDGNPQNNWLTNLRWDTPKSNVQDSIKHGVHVHGVKFPQSKLKDSDIPKIFQLSNSGMSLGSIGESFGVSDETIRRVLTRKIWKHVQVSYIYTPSAPLRGVDVHFAKLKETDIPKIFQLRNSGLTLKSISEIFGVSFQSVQLILSRKNWKHVQVSL